MDEDSNSRSERLYLGASEKDSEPPLEAYREQRFESSSCGRKDQPSKINL